MIITAIISSAPMLRIYKLNCLMTKPTKWHVGPAKTQISLGNHIHVNPPGSSGSLPEMHPDSRTPGSETEPPGCENTKKKKNFFFFFFFPRPSFLHICMVITVTYCWKAINS